MRCPRLGIYIPPLELSIAKAVTRANLNGLARSSLHGRNISPRLQLSQKPTPTAEEQYPVMSVQVTSDTKTRAQARVRVLPWRTTDIEILHQSPNSLSSGTGT